MIPFEGFVFTFQRRKPRASGDDPIDGHEVAVTVA